jgi:hypothetical protein
VGEFKDIEYWGMERKDVTEGGGLGVQGLPRLFLSQKERKKGRKEGRKRGREGGGRKSE